MNLLILQNIKAQTIELIKTDTIDINSLNNFNLDTSKSIEGTSDIIDRLETSIKLDYIINNSIELKWFDDIIDELERKNKRMALNITINNISLSYEYFCYYFVKDEIITIGYSDNMNIINDNSLSGILKCEFFDESISIYSGLQADFMDIIIDRYDTYFTIPKDFFNTLKELLLFKLTNLSFKTVLSYQTFKGVDLMKNDWVYTSKDVCNKLYITDQTLSNWRKKNIITYKKISDRKYLFSKKEVDKIFNDGVDFNNISNVNTKIYKKNIVNDNKENIKSKITEWVRMFSYKIPENKYRKQYFFLNFGNLNFKSSPHVMITDNLQLKDYIKNKIIISNPNELWNYLSKLSENSLEPKIDTSKRIYPGYSNFYLNQLFKVAERH